MKKKAFGLIAAVLVAMPLFVNAEEEALAKVNGKEYNTLQEAVNAVEDNGETATTITILRDATDVSGIMIVEANPKNIVIDFDGHTIDLGTPLVGSAGTVSQNLHFERGSKVVLMDGTVTADETARMLIQNYADLTLRNMTIDSTTSKSEKLVYTVSSNNGVVSIEGETNIYADETDIALDVFWWDNQGYVDGTQVTIDTTGVVEGIINVEPDTKATTENIKTTLVIKNINHVGDFIVNETMKNNVTIEDGTYTDEELAEDITLTEGTEFYTVETPEGETKYIAATEEKLEDSTYVEYQTETIEEAEEQIAQLDKIIEMLDSYISGDVEEADEAQIEEMTKMKAAYVEIKEILNEKNTVSIYDIVYGSYIGENWILDQEYKQPGKTVKVSLQLPGELPQLKDGFTRVYTIIRLHQSSVEGEDRPWIYTYEVDELPATEKDGIITFETDKFSTYVLAYEDVEEVNEEEEPKEEETPKEEVKEETKEETSKEEVKEESKPNNPGTFDGIGLYMIIGALSLISLVVLSVYTKKAKNY